MKERFCFLRIERNPKTMMWYVVLVIDGSDIGALCLRQSWREALWAATHRIYLVTTAARAEAATKGTDVQSEIVDIVNRRATEVVFGRFRTDGGVGRSRGHRSSEIVPRP